MLKTAIITGGSSGLGFEIAKNLASLGYRLVILARNQEKLDKAVMDIKSQGYDITGYQCDITNEVQLQNVFDLIKNKFIKIDFLILNAGVVSCKLLSDFNNAIDLKYDLENNLWGTIFSAYTFMPLVNKGGKILMISSAFGLMGPAAYSVYSASKAGIINFAESLRRELLCKKISVHVACPGDINTPQLHEEQKKMPEWLKQGDHRKAISAELAANRILKKCFKNKFLIIISFDIWSLLLLNKLTPRGVRDFLLDKMFPLPKDRN